MHSAAQVDKPWAKPVALRGHAREVTGVAWCPTDPLQVASPSHSPGSFHVVAQTFSASPSVGTTSFTLHISWLYPFRPA